MRAVRRFAPFLLSIALGAPAAAQPELFADLTPGAEEWHNFPRDLSADGEIAIFTRSTATTGRELWRSDGSEEGTFLLADACSGPCDGDAMPLGSEDGLHLFHAGGGLWRTDGSRAGTVRVASVRLDEMRVLGRIAAGFLLAWRLDSEWWLSRVGPGDQALEPLRRIGFSDDSPFAAAFSNAARTADGRRAFLFQGGARVVWVTDGTTQGTYPLPGFDGLVSAVHGLGEGMAIWEGDRLWSSDGSVEGTALLATFDLLPDGSSASRVTVRPAGGPEKLFFLLGPPSLGEDRRLWITDGTTRGTRELLRSPDLETAFGARGTMPVAGGRLAYRLGDRLWSTDGTAAGARVVEPPCAQCSWAGVFSFDGGFVLTLFRDGLRELWWSTGASGRPRKLLELPVEPFGGSDPPSLAEHGADLYLVLDERLVRLTPGAHAFDLGAALDEGLAAAGLGLLFSRAQRLWRTDGSAAEPLSLPGETAGRSHEPSGLTVLGDRLCFWNVFEGASYDLACATSAGAISRSLSVGTFSGGSILPLSAGLLLGGGGSLWVAGEGASEAVRVTNSLVEGPVALGGRAVFLTLQALGATDGSVEGTVSILEPAFANGPLVRVGDRAVLMESFESPNLWGTDGTADGTFELTVSHGFGARHPIVELDGVGWFLSFPGELWRTDGTPEGTRLAQSLPLDGWRVLPVAAAGKIFLTQRDDREHGLWVTDGTAPPQFVRSLDGFEDESRWQLFADGDRLWIAVDDGVHGREPWVSDGTPEGTHLFADLAPGPNPSSPHGFTRTAGRLFFVADDGETGAELWTADAAGARRLTDLAPGPDASSPSAITAWGDRLYFVADDGIVGREIWSLPLAGAPAGCQPSPTRLCLGGGRFAAEVYWRDPYNGGEGSGRAEPLPGSDRSGVFWFFDPSNVELIVKVLDAGPVNGHHWVFYGALSTVEYWLDVTDTATGRTRRYYNPPGEQCGRGDTAAFPAAFPADSAARRPSPEVSPRVAPPPSGAVAGAENGCSAADALCLLGGSLSVEVDWHDPRSGDRGHGVPIPGSDSTGWFWFFDAANVELVVKALDGTAVNGHRWVFYGGLSDVEYEIRVTETATGAERTYRNPFGEICGGADTAAF